MSEIHTTVVQGGETRFRLFSTAPRAFKRPVEPVAKPKRTKKSEPAAPSDE